MITNVILVLFNEYKRSISVSNVSYQTFDRFKYQGYSREKSIVIACFNSVVAKNVKSSIDALCSNDIKGGESYLCYNEGSLTRIKEIINIFIRYIKSIEIHSLDSIKDYDGSKNDIIYYSLNFYNVYKEIIRQLDDLIKRGAYFEKVKKVGIKSIIHNRTLPFLDEVKFPWVYNENDNVIIDYSKLVEWKSIGVFPNERKLVELKYFL